MTTLNNTQQSAVDDALDVLTARDDAYYGIFGFPGTGKSFTATTLINSFNNDWRIVFTAPTNKARHAIEQNMRKSGFVGECMTTYQFLNYTPKIDFKTGIREFIKTSKKRFDEPEDYSKTLLIVDEAGCLEKELVKQVFNVPCRKLFLGDIYQLPPVGEDVGIVFDLLQYDNCQLFECMRYGGYIAELADYIRQNIKSNELKIYNNNDGNNGVFRVSGRSLNSRIEYYVKSNDYLNTNNSFKIITYRNKTADYWGNFVRHILFGSRADNERFIPGEMVVALEPCIEKQDIGNFTRTITLLAASTEARIINVKVALDRAPKTDENVKCYFLECVSEYGDEITLRVIHEDDEHKIKYALNYCKQNKMWGTFWNIKDYFHEIQNSASITVRRSQGSGFKSCFVDEYDFKSCKDVYLRNRMLHVAVTRVEERVIL